MNSVSGVPGSVSGDGHSGIGETEQSDSGELAEAANSVYRAVMHQATGMLSVQLGATIDEALARLRAHAFAEGVSITDVARDVVAGTLRLGR